MARVTVRVMATNAVVKTATREIAMIMRAIMAVTVAAVKTAIMMEIEWVMMMMMIEMAIEWANTRDDANTQLTTLKTKTDQ